VRHRLAIHSSAMHSKSARIQNFPVCTHRLSFTGETGTRVLFSYNVHVSTATSTVLVVAFPCQCGNILWKPVAIQHAADGCLESLNHDSTANTWVPGYTKPRRPIRRPHGGHVSPQQYRWPHCSPTSLVGRYNLKVSFCILQGQPALILKFSMAKIHTTCTRSRT
jgi:hypothetical protein